MKRYLFIILCFFNLLWLYSQEQQTIELNREQVEALFLSNNLELIAAKYNIGIAEAAMSQARLWDNPNLSVGNVNLWSTQSQRKEIEDMASSFARNTEFSIELSQLIQTANKRGKLVRREKVTKEMAVQEFEEVLRGLKTEIRQAVYEIEYCQCYLRVLRNQQESLAQLVGAYKKQVQQGNIAKNELLRLQSSLLELENEINETQSDWNEKSKRLKILLNIPPMTDIRLTEEETVSCGKPDDFPLATLLERADEHRPDLKLQNLQTQFYRKSLSYEKSMRVPDLTLSAAYDRYGGVWKDFVGFGVSIDLPFINRNQGNIKAAKLSMEQSQYMEQQYRNMVQHEITASYNNYVYTYDFYGRIKEDSLLPELDGMLEAYTKNLMSRNISMLEYIDFMDAYKTNKQTMLNARKRVQLQFEELQYSIGTDIQ